MASPSLSSPSDYRGRLAPSPTGYLHLGHARTFWTAYQRSLAAHGTLVLRMEDLDPERSRAEYAQAALEDLDWLGIRWSEGPAPGNPDRGGPYAPYAQSQRLTHYLDAWRKLLRGGYLFSCRCSRKDLEVALSAPHEADANGQSIHEPLDDEPIYPGTCRPQSSNSYSLPESESPHGLNWRFRVPDGEAVEFVDGNLGPQRFVAGRDFGDFLVWRRDGVPSYQLACVVDDAAMKITEVVRGEDLLKSTVRQLLLHRALGFETPAWFHCRLLTDSMGRRLAKRHDALSLRTLRQRGLTPEQILSGHLPANAE